MKTRKSIAMVRGFSLLVTGFAFALMTLAPSGAEAAGGYVFKGARQNDAGGITAGQRRVVRGENGNYFKQGKKVWSDGSGNVKSRRAKSFQAPNGAGGTTVSSTNRSADGSLQHKSNVEYNGQNVNASSSGTVTKSADGQVSANKQTEVSTASGAGYSGSTSYDPSTGSTTTRVCTNQFGETVPCPKQ